jgi:methylenetetrahydrofolate dehydrogenase (NADP+)/methenyltetrahydrofolate cyclohydrolase
MTGENRVEKFEIKDDLNDLKNFNIIVSCVGIPNLIKKEMLRDGSILIDYGCSYLEKENGDKVLSGDFDVGCYENSKYYTPVPGGMGPIVVASLFENVVNCGIMQSIKN